MVFCSLARSGQEVTVDGGNRKIKYQTEAMLKFWSRQAVGKRKNESGWIFRGTDGLDENETIHMTPT